MSQIVTIALPDQTFEELRSAADAASVTPSQWIEKTLVQQFPPKSDDLAAARARLRPLIGCVQGGDPEASNNERIDRDLAKAYASEPLEPK